MSANGGGVRSNGSGHIRSASDTVWNAKPIIEVVSNLDLAQQIIQESLARDFITLYGEIRRRCGGPVIREIDFGSVEVPQLLP